MPARPIIIGRKFFSSSPGGLSYEYVLWADVPAARRSYFAKAGAVSRIPEVVAGDGGATAAESAAIASGAVAEQYGVGDWDNITFPTVPSIEAELQAKQSAWQTAVNGSSIQANPYANYGTSWNGTVWTVKTVA